MLPARDNIASITQKRTEKRGHTRRPFLENYIDRSSPPLLSSPARAPCSAFVPIVVRGNAVVFLARVTTGKAVPGGGASDAAFNERADGFQRIPRLLGARCRRSCRALF